MNYFEIELDREELFAIELDMDQRGQPGKRVSQMPKSRNRTGRRLSERTTRLPSVHKSWREVRAERRVRRIRLHLHPQEVLSVSPCGRLAFRSNSFVLGSTEYL